MQPELFPTDADAGPAGLRFVPDFIGPAQAGELLALIGSIELHEATHKDYTARRRVASFGGQFDYDANVLRDGPPVPVTFAPFIEQVAHGLGVAPGLFRHLLVAEYRPGTALGWHRDVPDFESIVGVSLLGTATMKFRRFPHRPGTGSHSLQLNLTPGSLYVIEGQARWHWQHRIAATREQRYSLTLRTSRGAPLLLGGAATGPAR